MIGLVIVAHGGLAWEMLAALEHVVGRQAGARAIAIGPDDDLRLKQDEIRAAVAEVDTGEGVAIVTDMFGGTPSNLAMAAARNGLVEVIYGANMPLLVKLAKLRNLPLEEAVARSVEAGRKYVNSVGGVLGRTGAAAS
ncbi:MAG: PTS fructose transporter subunit IIA [Paracoccaceae bacterium]|nr:MAG: PTS fructose transporter subunit IIA [Alphaproteobacteria bacterium]GIX12087.1 MAG: PTS fructose transporter subunit IIA [Paracoccaceae bacterium]